MKETAQSSVRKIRTWSLVTGVVFLTVAGGVLLVVRQVRREGVDGRRHLIPVPIAVPDDLEQRRLREHLEKIRRKVGDAFRRTDDRQRNALFRFEEEIENTVLTRETVEKAVDDLLDEVDSVEGITKIGRLWIYDKVHKTHGLDDYLRDRIRIHITEPLVERELARLRGALDQLQVEVSESDQKLLAEVVESTRTAPPDLHLPDDLIRDEARDLARIATELRQSLLEKGAAEAGLIAGGLTSTALARVLWHGLGGVLSPILRRFLAKTTAASILPFVDGPLPLADIGWGALEAAFLAWDGHALYKAAKKIRSDIRRDMVENLIEYRRDAREKIRDAGRTFLEKHQRTIQEIRERIERKLRDDT